MALIMWFLPNIMVTNKTSQYSINYLHDCTLTAYFYVLIALSGVVILILRQSLGWIGGFKFSFPFSLPIWTLAMVLNA